MLREVKNKHIKPRIAPFQLTTTASGVTVNIGYGDFTATRSGAGTGVLSLREGFSRNSLFFSTQSVGAGGYSTYNAATNNTEDFPYSILNAAGSGVEGSCEGVCYGWDSTDLSFVKDQRVAATQSAPRVIWGKITGTTGAVAIGLKDFSCTRSSAGVYVVTFTKAFAVTPVCLVTGVSGSSTTISPLLSTKTAFGITVTMTNASGTPADANFYIMAIGSDARSDSARGRMPLQNSQRRPKIIAGQVTMASGAPSISIGGATGGASFEGITDNGTGDFSMTVPLALRFKREPAIFLCSTTQRCQVRSNQVAGDGSLRILIQNAAGSNTDVDGVTNFLIIGSDDSSEY